MREACVCVWGCGANLSIQQYQVPAEVILYIFKIFICLVKVTFLYSEMVVTIEISRERLFLLSSDRTVLNFLLLSQETTSFH